MVRLNPCEPTSSFKSLARMVVGESHFDRRGSRVRHLFWIFFPPSLSSTGERERERFECAIEECGEEKYMEWAERQRRQEEDGRGRELECGKKEMRVMTEEQIEILRRQISAYSFISDLLVDMHKTFASPCHPLPGRLGNIWNDVLMTQGCLSMTARQRWAPTPSQLQTLEHLFRQVNGTPSKKKIKEITLKLAQHGQISETNVSTWFQNRRARSKRKQLKESANNLEAQVENEAESPEENQEMLKSIPTLENSTPVRENEFLQDLGISSKVCSVDPTAIETEVTFLPTDISRSSTGTVSSQEERTEASGEQ